MARPEDIDYLASTALFENMDSEYLEFIADHYRVKSCGPSEVLARVNEPADSIYIVMEGLLEILKLDEAAPVPLQTIGVDHVVGWSWAVAPYRWRFDVRTQTPAMVAELDARAIRSRCAQDTRFGYHLMTRMNHLILDRLNHVRTLLEMRMQSDSHRSPDEP